MVLSVATDIYILVMVYIEHQLLYMYIHNFTEPITVLINGAEVIPDGHIRAVNRVDINYQCIGDSVNDNIDLQWIALPDGQTPEVITADLAGFQVQYNYNEANLTVLNSVKPFAGKLRCYSPTTGASSTLTITASKEY